MTSFAAFLPPGRARTNASRASLTCVPADGESVAVVLSAYAEAERPPRASNAFLRDSSEQETKVGGLIVNQNEDSLLTFHTRNSR